MFKSVLVLESVWRPKEIESYSAFPFVLEFGRVCGIGVYYQTFTDARTLSHWVRIFNTSDAPGPRLLCFAAHGKKRQLVGLQKYIDMAVILKACRNAKSIEFVHFGCCLIGNRQNLFRLLRSCEHIRWASGYDANADWIDSMVWDLSLWRRLIYRDEWKGRRFYAIVESIVGENRKLARKLGFQFLYRQGNAVQYVEIPAP
jgi:hypothetical protein